MATHGQLKSENLQYNTMVRWFAGTNDLSTKRLMFQTLLDLGHSKLFCPIHVVSFALISILATDHIQKRRGEPGLFSFEYNLSPNLIST